MYSLLCRVACRVQARHGDAVARLERAWSFDEIPAPWGDVASQAAWLGLGQRPSNPGAVEAWMKKVQKETSR